MQNKNLLRGREYGYFLELHIELNCHARQTGNNKNSLGPGSLVENRAKKIGERSEPSVVPGEREGALQYPLGSLRSPIFSHPIPH